MNQIFVDFDEVQQCQGVSNVINKNETKKKMIVFFLMLVAVKIFECVYKNREGKNY